MIKYFFDIEEKKDIEPVRILSIGDSICAGTSNGTTSVVNPFYEWDGISLNLVASDVSSANTGSPYPSMADRFYQRLNTRPMHLVLEGSPGSEFSPYLDNNNWSESGNLYSPMVTKANSYLASEQVTSFDCIRITLGINDARGTTALSIIESDIQSLYDRLIVDFPNTPILINNLGKSSGGGSRSSTIRGYINDLVANNGNVYAGYNLNDFAASFYFDGLHLNQNGNNLLGQYDAELILNII